MSYLQETPEPPATKKIGLWNETRKISAGPKFETGHGPQGLCPIQCLEKTHSIALVPFTNIYFLNKLWYQMGVESS
jgi:hypothetical protein